MSGGEFIKMVLFLLPFVLFVSHSSSFSPLDCLQMTTYSWTLNVNIFYNFFSAFCGSSQLFPSNGRYQLMVVFHVLHRHHCASILSLPVINSFEDWKRSLDFSKLQRKRDSHKHQRCIEEHRFFPFGQNLICSIAMKLKIQTSTQGIWKTGFQRSQKIWISCW